MDQIECDSSNVLVS